MREVRRQNPGARSRETEDRCQKSEDRKEKRGTMEEGRGWRLEAGERQESRR